jgi:short-subunit dehydrogenase
LVLIRASVGSRANPLAASAAWVITFSESDRQEVSGSGAHVMARCPSWARAEFHERSRMDTSAIPDSLCLDQDELVDAAIRDYRRGVPVSAQDVPYEPLAGLSRSLPRRLNARLSARAGSRYCASGEPVLAVQPAPASPTTIRAGPGVRRR